MDICLPSGLFVITKEKDTVLGEIYSIANSLRKELLDKDIPVVCRACRYKIKALLVASFVDTRAVKKAIQSLDNSETDNVKLASILNQQMFYLLWDLMIVVWHSVHFDALPSCRSLLDCSLEEAQAMVVDLVGNGIVKDVSKTLFIGKEIYHFKEIEDVRCYYSDMLTSFKDDSAVGLQPSFVEQVFELKCREELEYCTLASLKVAGKLTKEVLEERQAIAYEYKRQCQKFMELNGDRLDCRSME